MSSAVPNKIKFSIDNPNIRDHGISNIDRFGQSIALSGSYMLIGAPREEQGPGFSPRRDYPNFQDPWSVREVTDIMRDYWATLYINWPGDLEIDITDQIDLETQTLLHNCTSNVFDLHEGLDIRSAAQREADWASDEQDRITELGYLLPNGYLDDEYRHPTGVLHFYAVETATRFNSIRRPLPPEASSYPMDIEPNFGYTAVIDDGKVATSAIRDHVGGYVAELVEPETVTTTQQQMVCDDLTFYVATRNIIGTSESWTYEVIYTDETPPTDPPEDATSPWYPDPSYTFVSETVGRVYWNHLTETYADVTTPEFRQQYPYATIVSTPDESDLVTAIYHSDRVTIHSYIVGGEENDGSEFGVTIEWQKEYNTPTDPVTYGPYESNSGSVRIEENVGSLSRWIYSVNTSITDRPVVSQDYLAVLLEDPNYFPSCSVQTTQTQTEVMPDIPTYRDDMTYCWDHDTYTLVPASNYVEECGMVYVFGLANQEFRFAIEPPVPETGMFFGFSMAAKNNVLVVGAPTATSSEEENAGRVWSFDMTTGTMLREFINPEITGNDLFGYSVAISDNYVAIGAPKDENNIDPEATPGTDEGRVYVYNRSTGAFIYSVKSPTPQDSGWFGYSVSITEGEFEGQQYNVLAVGAPGELDGDGEARGKCHLFRLPTGILAKTVISPEAAPVEGNDRDFFGAKVIVKGDMLAVGAPLAEAASDVFQTYSWTGDGVTTNFSIGGLLGDNILTVTVNGNTVTNYTVVETNIVFDVAPLSGSTIVAQLSLPVPADEYYSNLSRGIVYLYRITTTLDAVVL